MKTTITTVKVSSFNNPMTHRGVEYVLCPCADIQSASNAKRLLGFKTIIAQVAIHRNLRGKLDLHGNPYQPSQFLFVSISKF